MRTIERDIVSAVLVSRDGKILQAHKDPEHGGVYAGTWGIIGGGIDEGEDHRTALNREFMEETGLDISKYSAELIDEADGESERKDKATGEQVLVRMRFHVYRVVVSDRDASDIPITLDHEHSEYRWCEPSELKDLNLAPPSIKLFQKLGYIA